MISQAGLASRQCCKRRGNKVTPPECSFLQYGVSIWILRPREFIIEIGELKEEVRTKENEIEELVGTLPFSQKPRSEPLRGLPAARGGAVLKLSNNGG